MFKLNKRAAIETAKKVILAFVLTYGAYSMIFLLPLAVTGLIWGVCMLGFGISLIYQLEKSKAETLEKLNELSKEA